MNSIDLRKVLFTLVLGSLLLILAACGSEAEESSAQSDGSNEGGSQDGEVIKARLAHTYPIEEPVAKGAEKFAELAAEKSNGNIEISVFPSGQLYNDLEMPEALTTGQIELGMNTIEMWSGHVPAAEFSVLPLFQDYDQVHSALENGIDEIIATELKEVGVELLIWNDFGFGYFASSDEDLAHPDRFKGKRIRTTSPMQAKYVELLGGTPVTMGGAEVNQALQRGTIDAGLSGVTAFVAQRYFEMTDYYAGPQNVGLVTTSANGDWWNSLSEDAQSIIREAAEEAEAFVSEEVNKKLVTDMETLEAEGMTYVEVNPEDFQKVNEQLTQEYIEKSGEKGEQIIEVIQEATSSN